jgi:hypothetical protein
VTARSARAKLESFESELSFVSLGQKPNELATWIGENVLREKLSGTDHRWEPFANKLANNCYNKHQQTLANTSNEHKVSY